MLAILLEVTGIVLLAVFGYLLWPPAALLVLGAACFVVASRLARDRVSL